jgi:hypothetical protein
MNMPPEPFDKPALLTRPCLASLEDLSCFESIGKKKVKMISDKIKSLILEEQARQDGRFVRDVGMDTYLAKLGEKAEIVLDVIGGRCRGFLAFYCNNVNTRMAFITRNGGPAR